MVTTFAHPHEITYPPSSKTSVSNASQSASLAAARQRSRNPLRHSADVNGDESPSHSGGAPGGSTPLVDDEVVVEPVTSSVVLDSSVVTLAVELDPPEDMPSSPQP